ncbi:MAG: hypothetical protein ACFE75_09040 [Candidatus Hodarchaeota archaeon]
MKFQNKMKLGVSVLFLLLLFTTCLSIINIRKENDLLDVNKFLISAPEDSYEPNDYYFEAYDITFNEGMWLSSINGTGTQADYDYYKIDIALGYEHLKANLTFSNSSGNIDLLLCDNTGFPINGSLSTTDNEYIDFIVPISGIYYLLVLGQNASNIYDLWWISLTQILPDDWMEENDDYLNSKYIDPNYYSGLTIVNGDEDWFHVYLNPGEIIDVAIFFNQMEGDLDLELWDPSYTPRIGSYFNPNNESISFSADMSGDWRIRIYHKYGNSSLFYDLDLWLNPGDDWMEENDDYSNSKYIDPNYYSGLTIVDGDEDWFHLYLNTGDIIDVHIYFDNWVGNLQLELWDPSNSWRTGSYSDIDSKESISTTADVSGDWRIRVYHKYGNSSVSYDLDIWLNAGGPSDDWMEENDGYWSSAWVDQNYYSGLMIVKTDEDWFHIYLNPSDVIDVQIYFNNWEGNLQLELYDPLDSINPRIGSYSDMEYKESVTYRADISGDWRIRVYHEDGNSDVVYDLEIRLKDDFYEFNNHRGEAYFLGEHERIWLSDLHGLAVSGDEDWYVIDISPGFMHLMVSLTFNHSLGNIDITISDEWNSIAIGGYSFTDNEYINVSLPHPGIYFIQIHGQYWGNEYNLWWDDLRTIFSDDLYEPNNDLSSAFDITLYERQWLSSDWINGLGVQYDDDWYEIYVNPGFLRLEVMIAYDYAEGAIGFKIYDGELSEITGNFTMKDHEFINYKLPSNGTYYIKIYGDRSGNVYNLRWSTFEDEDRGRIPGYDILILIGGIVGTSTIIIKKKRSKIQKK